MKNEEKTTETKLSNTHCESCESGKGRVEPAEIKRLMGQLHGSWKLKDDIQLENTFTFPDFKEALNFVNQVGEIAEAQQHHPDIFLTYGGVRIQLSTHSAKGLTKNDFILAAKIDELK